jgi:hypothetical protein
MRTRIHALLVLGLSGLLLLSGGCVRGSSPARPVTRASTAAPSPTATPARTELLEALQRSQRTAHRYTVHSNLPEGGVVDGTGAVDPRARVFQSTTKFTGGTNPSSSQQIVIGTNLYQRTVGTETWVHLDLKRVKKTNRLAYFDVADPTGMVKFISMIRSVQPDGPHAYRGLFNAATQDSTPFLPVGAPSVVSIGSLESLFTATTDDRGWVTSLTMELVPSKGPNLTMTTRMRDHGKPLQIKAPPKALIREAADFYYS